MTSCYCDMGRPDKSQLLVECSHLWRENSSGVDWLLEALFQMCGDKEGVS